MDRDSPSPPQTWEIQRVFLGSRFACLWWFAQYTMSYELKREFTVADEENETREPRKNDEIRVGTLHAPAYIVLRL